MRRASSGCLLDLGCMHGPRQTMNATKVHHSGHHADWSGSTNWFWNLVNVEASSGSFSPDYGAALAGRYSPNIAEPLTIRDEQDLGLILDQ